MGIFARMANAIRPPRVIKRPVGRPPAVVRRSPAIPPLPIYEQFTRIGGGLTPLAVSSIIREADTGDICRLVDLANEARQKDCHLQSLLGTRETALIGLRWSVEPATPDNERDKEVADFVKEVIKNACGTGQESRSFVDLIGHLSGAVFYGYSSSEIEWQRSGGKLTIKGFRNVSHRRFNYRQSDGRLVYRDSFMGPNSGIELQEAYPDLFIQHQPRITGDVMAREGLIRVLMWAALFRNWALTDWLRLAELAWKPWRIGKYKPDASTEDINDLYDALEGLTSNGVGVFSDRADVNVEWPERGRGGKPEHAELAEWLGAEMSKCVLGQTLTVEQGERGARSLGEVHDRVRLDIRELDAISVAQTIMRDVIAPLVRLNFGTDTALPLFFFVTDDTVDIGALSRAVEGLVRAGCEIPQPWVRDKFGAPDPQPGDKLCLGKEVLQAEMGDYIPTNVQFQGEVPGAQDDSTDDADEGSGAPADEEPDDEGSNGEAEGG